jgi:hypothetical protein
LNRDVLAIRPLMRLAQNCLLLLFVIAAIRPLVESFPSKYGSLVLKVSMCRE